MEVLNKSIIGVRKHVGKGKIDLRMAVPKCGKDTMVTVDPGATDNALSTGRHAALRGGRRRMLRHFLTLN